MTDQKLLRISDVLSIVPMSRRQLYRLVETGAFPRPIKLSTATGKNGAVAWLASDVTGFINSRIEQSRAVPTPAPVEA